MNLPSLASDIVSRIRNNPDSPINCESLVASLIQQELDKDKPKFEPLPHVDQFRKMLDDQMTEIIKRHNIATNNLTIEQMVVVIRQAIECGDIYRLVRQTDNAQQVVYVPFRESESLKSRVEQLKSALQKHHDHHSESCVVYFEQDGKPIEISVDLGEAYQDSDLCELTCRALARAIPA